MLTPQIADKGVTKHILRAFDLHASRRLGQNFLISPGVVRAVVEAAEIENGDRVLEIGPGIGTMTQYLCENAREVVAVEIDKNLIPIIGYNPFIFKNVKIPSKSHVAIFGVKKFYYEYKIDKL